MSKLCIYFELHQPYRLEEFSVFNLGQGKDYFQAHATESNRIIFQKVARKSYVPMLRLLARLVKRHPDFRFAFSCSGVFLEQAQNYAPVVLDLLKGLVHSGQVEVLAETYYHSLAALYSPKEFREQVKLQEKHIKKLFGVTPKVFRNTELIYSNDIARQVAALGYTGMITEAVDRCLHGRERTQVFASATPQKIGLLLKHAQLSDDVAFRFSDKSWASYPLTAPTYLHWLESYDQDQIINLFMDFETFGEHQWEDTGIFEFFGEFIRSFLQGEYNACVTPSDVLTPLQPSELEKLPVYDVPVPISWADVDRDLTAWTDNALQKDTIRVLYELEAACKTKANSALLDQWRKLQTSDHFYYMCTKWAADGDVHAYFSPYQTPFEAYRRYAIVLADLQEKLIYTK